MVPFFVVSILILTFNFEASTITLLFKISFFASLGLTLKFLIEVINQITSYLNIHCFKIKAKI